MKYKIEFLSESTDETSVKHFAYAKAVTLLGAQQEADLSLSEMIAPVDGYQIRDESGAIVLLHHMFP